MLDMEEFAAKIWATTGTGSNDGVIYDKWAAKIVKLTASRDAELIKVAEEAALRRAANVCDEITESHGNTFAKAVLALIPDGGHLARYNAELHQFYQSGEAWSKHEIALADKLQRTVNKAYRKGTFDANDGMVRMREEAAREWVAVRLAIAPKEKVDG